MYLSCIFSIVIPFEPGLGTKNGDNFQRLNFWASEIRMGEDSKVIFQETNVNNMIRSQSSEKIRIDNDILRSKDNIVYASVNPSNLLATDDHLECHDEMVNPSKKHHIDYNLRTPDLDRICRIFKSNKASDSNFLNKIKQNFDESDTPLTLRSMDSTRCTESKDRFNLFKKLKENEVNINHVSLSYQNDMVSNEVNEDRDCRHSSVCEVSTPFFKPKMCHHLKKLSKYSFNCFHNSSEEKLSTANRHIDLNSSPPKLVPTQTDQPKLLNMKTPIQTGEIIDLSYESLKVKETRGNDAYSIQYSNDILIPSMKTLDNSLGGANKYTKSLLLDPCSKKNKNDNKNSLRTEKSKIDDFCGENGVLHEINHIEPCNTHINSIYKISSDIYVDTDSETPRCKNIDAVLSRQHQTIDISKPTKIKGSHQNIFKYSTDLEYKHGTITHVSASPSSSTEIYMNTNIKKQYDIEDEESTQIIISPEQTEKNIIVNNEDRSTADHIFKGTPCKRHKRNDHDGLSPSYGCATSNSRLNKQKKQAKYTGIFLTSPNYVLLGQKNIDIFPTTDPNYSEVEKTQDLPELDDSLSKEQKSQITIEGYREFNGFEKDAIKDTGCVMNFQKKMCNIVMMKELNTGKTNLIHSCSKDQLKHDILTKSCCLNLNQSYQSEQLKYPKRIKYTDPSYLTKDDIMFKDSIWYCDSGLKYYPGKILHSNAKINTSCVLLSTGTYNINQSDIFYLDIRISDMVIWNKKLYHVFALEYRPHEHKLIECIRGYNFVHLKLVRKSGTLGKKVLVKPLSSISLNLNEWIKRPKIILNRHSHILIFPFRNPQYSLKGHNVTMEKSNSLHNSNEDTVCNMGHLYKTNTEEMSTPCNNIGIKSMISSIIPTHGGKIFEKCIFVFTNLPITHRDELMYLIESESGTIISSGFSSYLDYKEGSLVWIDNKYKSYRFAGLITEKHVTSPKYLETLALGWPILHWKFICYCLEIGRFDVEKLFTFLLPSGESCRLTINSGTKSEVVKSSNIFKFYVNILSNKTLGDQLSTSTIQMTNFSLLIYKKSNFNRFLEFIWSCYRVPHWDFIEDSTKSNSRTDGETIDDNLIHQLVEFCSNENDKEKLIYINIDDEDVAKELKKRMILQLQLRNCLHDKIHIESKEWLIQSIINEDLGFRSKGI